MSESKFKIGDTVIHSSAVYKFYKLKIIGISDSICFLDLRGTKLSYNCRIYAENVRDYNLPKDWSGTNQNVVSVWLTDITLVKKCKYCYDN